MMSFTAVLEFVDKTEKDFWQRYDVYDPDERLVGVLYLERTHLPPENLELYRKEQNNE